MQSNIAPEGMVVTPNHLASQTAIKILRDGGTAMDAMVAAAATIAVVYPHMNGIGGDGFWLIMPPHGDPISIEACGAAGSLATEEFFEGLNKIPSIGPKSAITVAGTVGGWQEVLNYVSECGYSKISAQTLLSDAIKYAEDGYPVTESQIKSMLKTLTLNNIDHNFARVLLKNGEKVEVGDKFYQKELANTLKSLAKNGLGSFYEGEVATKIAEDMNILGLPITGKDLATYSPIRKVPLRMSHKLGELYNIPPPSQGIASLLVLGILDKLEIDGKDEGKLIHSAVEATKQAFELRNEYVTDPQYMKIDPKLLLSSKNLSKLASNINFEHTSSAGKGKSPGDTIWMGAMDKYGFSVAFIQSLYHEFGSAVLLPETGILWHNRGVAFSLEKNHILSIKPGKKPLHTLTLASAQLHDGRIMIYGTRGGDGQPQTQAAVFYRYAVQNMKLQAAINSPRWLYGRICGDHDDNLKLEGRFGEDVINYLKERGHNVVMLPDYSELVGHAGALVRHPNGMMEGAFDPRSNGSAVGF